ncbi:MAG: B12-binding domain-containing radical SAM protein [Magnetococcales bacterium]|nr:B12-binding domain-containing radical SAM protein [Magnetococcales bacterium]
MTDIALVRAKNNPSVHVTRGHASREGGQQNPPYGILYIAKNLNLHGYRSRIFDRFQDHYWPLTPEEMAREILGCHPGVVGISANTSQCRDTFELADALRRLSPQTPVLLGGNHFSSPNVIREALQHATAVMSGEGEKSVLQGMQQGPQAFSGHLVGQALTSDEMNAIPFPGKADLEQTAFNPALVGEFPLLTAKGCPFDCVFCKDGHRTAKLRYFSVDYVVDALESMHRDYGFDRFFILDDVFVYSVERMEEMIRALERKRLKFHFRCFLHPNTIKEEPLRLMKRLGVRWISIGIESGDDRIHSLLGKKTNLERIRRGVGMCKEQGFDINGLFMLGNIGETRQSMERTIALADELPTDADWFSFAVPFPGTAFYDQVERYGTILEPDFSKWNNQELVYLPNGVTEADMQALMAQAQEIMQRKMDRYQRHQRANLRYWLVRIKQWLRGKVTR